MLEQEAVMAAGFKPLSRKHKSEGTPSTTPLRRGVEKKRRYAVDGSLDAPPQLLRTIVVEDIERQEEVVGKGKSEHLIRPQSRPPSPGTFSVDL